MAKSQELQPGPEHQRLGNYVGTWKVDVAFKETPMGPAKKEVWTFRFESFPGKFQVVYHAELVGSDGKTAELGFMGYDAEKHLYFFDTISSDGMKWDLRAPVEPGMLGFAGEQELGGKPLGLRLSITEESPTTFKYTVQLSQAGGAWVLAREATATKIK
jgi:hypothetical protein